MTPVGRSRVRLDTVDSTQSWLGERWHLHPEWPNGMLVTAREQTAGRGQQDSRWLTEAGANFTGTFLLRNPALAPDRVFQLNKITALAVRAAAAELALDSAQLQVKWPNDVVYGGKKLAGILPQVFWKGAKAEAALLGIGLNVNQIAFAPEIQARAVSLALMAGHPLDLEAVTDTLCTHLDGWMDLLVKGQHSRIDQEYLFRLHRYQEWAEYRVGSERITASIIGVDTTGRLALESAAGLLRVLPKEIAYL